MKLQVWRTTGKNPCVAPPVFITIAPVEENTWVFPWVLPLGQAIEIFGEGKVALITEEAQVINLIMHHSGREF